ncbi:hypothetical protein EG329_006346 [Mollisiaceae sp. DMI_Dod_QoI]|nr:hypothetical protein EG329_006346 [Helotiales sp. DMI_Dod_QoI]
MTPTPPVVQFLSRNNYEKQYLVALPNILPLPKLAPSSIRIKTSILSLTANNLTYGRIGHILRVWDVHHLPSSIIPAEYSDLQNFGRIPAWGYATVIESNVARIEVGAQVFGLHPIGTLPFDMEVKVNPQIPSQFFEVSKERENVMPLYNQYIFYPPIAQRTLEQKQSQGYDALFQVFFTTSYLMNRFIFPWIPAEFVHPVSVEDSWTVEKGFMDEKTIVLVFADSGKTALALAYLLKNGRPAGKKPQMIVGIGSSASRNFVQATGLYDKAMTYDSDSGELVLELDLTSKSKVVVCEFGSRGDAGNRWANKLRESHDNVVQLIVAGEVVRDSPEKATEKFLARTKNAATVFNASAARVQAIEVLGEKKYFEELSRDWLSFKKHGLVKGLHMVWGEGMEEVGKGWDKLCKGEVGSDQGLVFSLY